MPIGITPIIGADEYLNHQIVNSFASVAVPDISWTEKVWSSMARRDGGMQVNFGIGKYINRNVIDGFAGLSSGVSQYTVRASRELSNDYETIGAGPLRYEIIEPLKKVRFVLDPNKILPLSYDITFEQVLPALFEGRDTVYEKSRHANDVVRYYQAGSVRGEINLEGERIEVRPEEWFAFRDRSWGVRKFVGLPAPDLQPSNQDYFQQRFFFNWCVTQLRRPEGGYYGLQYHYRELGEDIHNMTGHIDESDGTRREVAEIIPDLKFSAQDRSFAGGTVTIVLRNRAREKRVFEIEPLSDTAFNLQPGLYYPWKGQVHGTWKGMLHEDGELIPDRREVFDAREQSAWQLRDRPVRIREGDAVGYGILESVINGDWPGAFVD